MSGRTQGIGLQTGASYKRIRPIPAHIFIKKAALSTLKVQLFVFYEMISKSLYRFSRTIAPVLCARHPSLFKIPYLIDQDAVWRLNLDRSSLHHNQSLFIINMEETDLIGFVV